MGGLTLPTSPQVLRPEPKAAEVEVRGRKSDVSKLRVATRWKLRRQRSTRKSVRLLIERVQRQLCDCQSCLNKAEKRGVADLLKGHEGTTVTSTTASAHGCPSLTGWIQTASSSVL